MVLLTFPSAISQSKVFFKQLNWLLLVKMIFTFPFCVFSLIHLFLLHKTETRRLHVKFIWLYCSHCAYCRCFQKVRLQWHLVAALGHCNSAYQLSLWPCQVGSFVLFICNHPALTQQQAQAPHSAANERTNPKPPTLPPTDMAPQTVSISVCETDVEPGWIYKETNKRTD